MIQRYRLNRISVTNKKDQKCSKVTVHAYNNDKWGSRLASQSGGGTGWWLWYTVVVVQSDGGGGGWWCWYRVGTNYSHLLSHDDRRVTERQEVDQGSTRRRRRGEGGQWIKNKEDYIGLINLPPS